MRKMILATAILAFSFCSSTWAWWPEVKNYKELKAIETMRTFVEGVGRGLSIANAVMGSEIGGKLFCPPSSFALTVENYFHILDEEIVRSEETKGYDAVQKDPIDILLLYGLQNTFPCK